MSRRTASPPVVLTIAGSDNSCGAGIQADLKTFGAFGVYGLTAVTCVVSEVPGRVEKVQAVTPEVLRSQIRILFEAYPVTAVKTGMLYSRALLRVVSEELADRLGMFHLVVDPVMVASSGIEPAKSRPTRPNSSRDWRASGKSQSAPTAR